MRTGTLAIGATALILAACGQATPEKDRPDPGTPTAAAAAPAPVSAQNQALIAATPQVSLSEAQRAELRELAKGYIDDAARENATGFSAVAGVEDAVVALQPTETHSWPVSLRAGETYRIIGGCDNECTDMDLELIDPTGKIVERDTLPDSFPILNIAPAAAGNYVVRFVMKTCTIGPCYAAARLYRQTGSTTSAGQTRAT